MKKLITVIEGREPYLNIWRTNLSKIERLGFESHFMPEMPERTVELLRPHFEGRTCFVIIGDTGGRRPSGCHIHDAISMLGFDQFIAMASEFRTSRFDLGNPVETYEERAEEHLTLLSAFLAGMKNVGPIVGTLSAPTRFDYLPKQLRRPNLDPEMLAIYRSLGMKLT